jgi:hypothetical protein
MRVRRVTLDELEKQLLAKGTKDGNFKFIRETMQESGAKVVLSFDIVPTGMPLVWNAQEQMLEARRARGRARRWVGVRKAPGTSRRRADRQQSRPGPLRRGQR